MCSIALHICFQTLGLNHFEECRGLHFPFIPVRRAWFAKRPQAFETVRETSLFQIVLLAVESFGILVEPSNKNAFAHRDMLCVCETIFQGIFFGVSPALVKAAPQNSSWESEQYAETKRTCYMLNNLNNLLIKPLKIFSSLKE